MLTSALLRQRFLLILNITVLLRVQTAFHQLHCQH